MQSTGVYWIPLYEILEERGLEVYLVNARHTKNLPGRKSDVQESQWLLKIAHLWATEQLVPTRVRDSGASNLLAATGRTRA
jgi:transposase